MADAQRAEASGITFQQFEGEVFSAYDTFFNVWLLSKDARVSNKYIHWSFLDTIIFVYSIVIVLLSVLFLLHYYYFIIIVVKVSCGRGTWLFCSYNFC